MSSDLSIPAISNIDDYLSIPETMMNNMLAYVKSGEPLSGFLYALFSNDLFLTFNNADAHTKSNIGLYIKFVWWELPFECHGSPEIVKNWMIERRKEIEENNT